MHPMASTALWCGLSLLTASVLGAPLNLARADGKTFENPVIWQDYPDLDVFRIGDVFYYSSSTFAFSPGAPVLKSYDLANWVPVSHSVPRLNFGLEYDLNNATSRAYVKGIWASTLQYRESSDTFYWMGCIGDGPTYVWTATGTNAAANNGEVEKWNWTERGTGLQLKTATVTNDLFAARNTLTRRIPGPKSAGTFKIDISGMRNGDRAGAVLFRDIAAYIGVHKSGNTSSLVMVDNLNLDTNWVTNSTGTVAATGPKLASNATEIWFQIKADITPAFSNTNAFRTTTFCYSFDGNSFTQLGEPFRMSNTWQFFTGYRFGAFNFATKALGGHVKIRAFDLEML